MKRGREAPDYALAEFARQSMRATRHKLELAMRRLTHGNTRVVPKGTKISPASVAKEAGVDRSTLYRFHEPILAEIRNVKDAKPKTELRESRAKTRQVVERLKEYRLLTEKAQAEVTALARINYRLQARIDELESKLKVRDERIAALQREINKPSEAP